MKKDNSITSSKLWRIIMLSSVLVIMLAVLVYAFMRQNAQVVNSYEQCKDAGGMILETYPEQCTKDGKSFTNTAQQDVNVRSSYVGLTEQEALDKAADEGKTARVIQRDAENLPVTMDFSPGRLNLSVAEGKVYMVQVEGESE